MFQTNFKESQQIFTVYSHVHIVFVGDKFFELTNINCLKAVLIINFKKFLFLQFFRSTLKNAFLCW